MPSLKEIIQEPSHENIARYILQKYNDNCITVDKKLKVWDEDNSTWLNDEFARKYLIDVITINFVEEVEQFKDRNIKHLDELVTKNKIGIDKRDKKVKFLETTTKKIKKLIGTYSYVNDILKFIKDKTVSNIKFNTTEPYKIPFNNGVFDVLSKKLIPNQKTFYFDTSVGYDYIQPTDDEINYLTENVIKTVFVDEDERDFYLEVLSTGLIGEYLPYFIYCIGCGRNGKGLLHELMTSLLGGFSTVSDPSLLLTSGTTDNVKWANLHQKRFVCFSEPDNNRKISSTTVKDLTGGSELKRGRALYCSRTVHDNAGSYFIETNYKLTFDSVTGVADIERLIVVRFRSYAPVNYEEERMKVIGTDMERYIFRQNPYFKSPEFKTKYRCALLHILANSYQQFFNRGKKFNIPQSFREESEQLLRASGDVNEWVNDVLVKDENSKTQIKELFSALKYSNLYNNLSKADKRKYNRRYLEDMIKNSPFYRNNFKDIIEIKTDTGRKTTMRSVIIGYKMVYHPDDTDDVLDELAEKDD
jgi:hypothetical protein